MAAKKIAIVVGSTRSPRVGLSLSQLIHKHLSSTLDKSPEAPKLELLDINDHRLPYFDEPGVPMRISSPDQYEFPHTQAWSRTVSSYSAFVFVTPQYNWGIPGGLKNNLDYLFTEWKGKPAMVVSYGGRGGGKAAENLKNICSGLRMDLLQDHVELNMGKIEGQMAAGCSEGKLLSETEEALEEELKKAKVLFGEVVKKVQKGADL